MHTLINICGVGRSGTTMLDLMLGNAQDAFSCGELYAWFRPWRTHHLKISCSCNKLSCPIWDKIKNYPESKFHQKIFEQLNANFVIDSSKEISWIIDNNNWAFKNSIRVVNLLIWKHPVHIAYSHWKRGRSLWNWHKSFILYYHNFFQANIPFYSVNYNELASEPVGKLKDICGKLNMEYFEGKERFWEKQHHHLYGSLGIREQLADGYRARIKSVENFPEDFEKHISHLKQRINNDLKILSILEKLEKFEISNDKLENNNSIIKFDSQRPIVYPIWYYTNRFKRFYRKLFLLKPPQVQ